MPKHTEPLSGGLVTAPDAAFLQPGELSDIRNAVYRPGNQSLHRATGRSVFGVVSATAQDVVGLRDIKFDNGEHYLLSFATSTAFITDVGDSGATWTSARDLNSLGSPSQMEVVHYNNRFFVLNGLSVTSLNPLTAANSNFVVYLSSTAIDNPTAASVRPHGLLAVTSAPVTGTSAAAANLEANGFYEYWTTEVAEVVIDGEKEYIESTFAAENGPATVNIADKDTTSALIKRPPKRNDIATHWRVYRSPKKDLESDKRFPKGFMIAQLGTATAQVVDTTVTASAGATAASFNSGAEIYSDFTNAGNMAADDTSFASATGAGPTTPATQGCYNFNVGTINGAIKGIEVEIAAYTSGGPTPIAVTIGATRQATGDRAGDFGFTKPPGVLGGRKQKVGAKSAVVVSTDSGNPDVITLGSPTDQWIGGGGSFFNMFFDTEVSDNSTSGFMAVITTTKSGDNVGIDYILIKVYYAATTTSVEQFPTVVYTFGDDNFEVGKKGPPPSASTGDVFQGSLVLNDVESPSFVRYSFPLEPESFPETYFIDFETRENDQVRLIKVVNNRLIVGLDSSLWRINYLPSERDASFDRGRAKEAISKTFGIINPMCAATFSPTGSREFLAFVSNKGVYGTEGFNIFEYTNHLDWRAIFPTTASAIALINDPENRELIFYFNDTTNGVEHQRALHLSYAPDHFRDGRLKISGLVHMRNDVSGTKADLKSAWAVPRSSGGTSIYLGYGGTGGETAGAGKVYIETGSTIPAADPSYLATSRRMFLAGRSKEWALNGAHTYFSSHSGTPAMRLTTRTVETNGGAESAMDTDEFTLDGSKLYRSQFQQVAEGMRMTLESTANHDDLAADEIIMDVTDADTEDSGS